MVCWLPVVILQLIGGCYPVRRLMLNLKYKGTNAGNLWAVKIELLFNSGNGGR